MGRKKKEVDIDEIYDLVETGRSQKQIADELGVSVPTLSNRIAEIQSKQGVILQYRAIQNLQLTELQARVLEAITPEKIEEASLSELVSSFRILKDKELTDIGKPTDVKGIMHYLIQMEKEEAAIDMEVETIEEGTVTTKEKKDLKNYTPKL